MIPLEVLHVASLGPDVLLGALALGAAQVVVLCAGSEAPEYIAALERELDWLHQILRGLGYEPHRLQLVAAHDPAALESAVWSLPLCEDLVPATFSLSNEKRRTLDFVLDHLARHAPRPVESLALSAPAPFGRVEVNRTTCTMCMSCVGACPSGALLDSKETPQLRFIERNCVQCGLCANTCPEDAIALTPRLLLTAQAKTPVVLNETEPFHCVRCQKPFGTRQMIDNMLGRLTGHSMFSRPEALRRLQMCADCRVLDVMEQRNEATIFDYPGSGGAG